MEYVVSFTACLQEPQGNLQTHSPQGRGPRHRKNLNRLTVIAACRVQHTGAAHLLTAPHCVSTTLKCAWHVHFVY